MPGDPPPSIRVDTDKLQFRDGETPNIQVSYFTRAGRFTKTSPNLLLWIHGIGEHALRYEPFAQRILASVPALDAICSYDQRGHGKSQGKRGWAEGVDQLVEDFVKKISPKLALEFGEDANIIIGGHSMGGLVCAGAATRSDWLQAEGLGTIKGILLSSPAVKVAVEGTMNRMLAPVSGMVSKVPGVKRFTKGSGLDANKLSHVKAEVEKYLKDDLVHDQMGVGLAADMLVYGDKVIEKVGEGMLGNIPCLVLHGKEDGICLKGGSEKLTQKMGESGELEVLDGGFHETFHDVNEVREAFFTKVEAFMKKVFA